MKRALAVSLFVTMSLFSISFAGCPSADLTDDCFVNCEDFAIIAEWWLEDCNSTNNFCDGADFDLSSQVDPTDLAILAADWLDDGREEVPNVVGMTQSSAEAAITGAGLTVGTVITQCSDTISLYDVISQNPVSGVLLLPGGAVNLVVSLGPEVDMTWFSINDPGVSGHEGFNGEMSKYETTNAQYCQFLNAALASGDITLISPYPDEAIAEVLSGNYLYVYGANGSNGGADFVYTGYYYLAGPGYTHDGATSGGAARINWTGSLFTVDSGFENHPVTYVSWYGATAFADYYGWRLPTEWEWQAVADYDGSYTYGHGAGAINNSLANYYGSLHPYGTTAVGSYGTIHGYGMNDMAGNVWEWTSSCYDENTRIVFGGCWRSPAYGCAVSHGAYFNSTCDEVGFRVCR